MICFCMQGCTGGADGCGGCGPCVSQLTKPKMADLHDRPGQILSNTLTKLFSRESPCSPSTMFFMHFWFFGQSAGSRWVSLIPHSRRPMSDGRTLPFLYKLSWGLEVAYRTFCFKIAPFFQNMVSTIALLISVLYWTLLHPAVVEYGFLKVWFFSIQWQGNLSLSCHRHGKWLSQIMAFLPLSRGRDHGSFTLTFCCGVQLSKSVAFSL